MGKNYFSLLLVVVLVLVILNLLPSNYISAIQGPNYTIELKAVAVELAKIELALEDVDLDRATVDRIGGYDAESARLNEQSTRVLSRKARGESGVKWNSS